MGEIYKIPQYNIPNPQRVSDSKRLDNYTKKVKRHELEKLNKEFDEIEKRVATRQGKIWYLYLLELEHGMYYLGTTTNVKRRFEQHKRGSNYGGAKWTSLHKPKSIVSQQCLGRMRAKDACKIEQIMFNEYFTKYGYSLRGAGRCQVNANW